MESLLNSALNTTTLKPYGHRGGGCINEGQGYQTDFGAIFVKKNEKSQAKVMFDGEFESLAALYATDVIKVAKPIKVIENPSGGAVFVAEYVEMNSGLKRFAQQFGKQLAELHLQNAKVLKQAENNSSFLTKIKDGLTVTATKKFGFNTSTCCGFIPQDNTWSDNWVEFYARQRLKPQIENIAKEYGNREIVDLWSQLERKMSQFFVGAETITPALLHGDLWNGNVGETDKEPVIFDPASFYGHAEYELGIATLFGGFPPTFYNAYHEIIPKAPNFEKRLELYQLFHNLNHWNHFGESYKGSSLSLMKRLCRL